MSKIRFNLRMEAALKCWPEKYFSQTEEALEQALSWWEWNRGPNMDLSRFRADIHTAIGDAVNEHRQQNS